MSRKNILTAFKSLQRISQKTFEGDSRAINEARKKINVEFRKETKEEEIGEKLKISYEVGAILQKQVVQAVKNPESDKFGEIIKRSFCKFLL